MLVPPIRIERTTNGLGISDRGLLKSMMTWAIPFVYAGILTFTVLLPSLLFVACRLGLFAWLTPI